MSSGTGRVILVGAGPGAPDLITVRGDAALRTADVVLYDSLVGEELLARVPPQAERVDVGKRGHDAPTREQDDIHTLMVARAREGKTVVRLKGGDPFVFGRGGEELSACRAAGIPVEVVPGVSSPIGALAYAGIPVTDRRHAASFAVVTGHKDPSEARERLDWAGLARSADTLVVLMGMRNLEEITERLIEAGRAPDTPAAVVMHGTTPQQRVVEAPLDKLAARVREAGLAAPAAIVVGEVVRLREELAWYDRKPLFGRRILVTRSAEQAPPWLAALGAAGAEAVNVPLIAVEGVAEPPGLDDAIRRIRDFDLLLLTSANAVRHLEACLAPRGVKLSALRARTVCVGPATAAAAQQAGLAVTSLPVRRFDAEGLFEAVAAALPLAGARCLVPRAEAGRPVLLERLTAAGAEVLALDVYRTVAAAVDAEAFRARLCAREFDTLSFASPSAVRAFVGLLDGPSRAAAEGCVVAAIGPVTAAALAEAGLPAAVVPARAEAEALVEALERHAATDPGEKP